MINLFKKEQKEPKDIKEVLEYIESLEKKVDKLSNELNNLEKKEKLAIQKIGFLRFNPFEGIGGDQSFAIALLDYNNNGVIITSMYSREGNRVYAKPIEKGLSKYSLSDEEKETIKKAIEIKNEKQGTAKLNN